MSKSNALIIRMPKMYLAATNNQWQRLVILTVQLMVYMLPTYHITVLNTIFSIRLYLLLVLLYPTRH